jgi:NDP-sugar pyrophosphorylase family protein
MKAVILAGGKGTRLTPYTLVFPKPLMPVGDTPILEIVIRQLGRCGFTDVTLAVGHLAALINAYFEQGSRFGVQIRYSKEENPLGTAGPLHLIADLDEPFLVMNGDVLTTLDYRELYHHHCQSGAIATIAMHDRTVKIDLGVIECDDEHTVTGYIEKPTYKHRVSMGVYVFDPRVLNYIPQKKRFDFPDLVLQLLDAEERVVGYPYDGYWMDIGRADDYGQATADFEQMRDSFLPKE